MIAAKCSSFSSKLWNHRPKQLAALCLLGQSFSKETRDSSADGSLNQQAAPPTAKKTSNPSACCPSKDVNPVLAWTSLYFQKLLAVCFRLNAWLVGRRMICGAHCSPWWKFVLQRQLWYWRTTSTRHPRMGVTTFGMAFLSFWGTQFVLAKQQQACWWCYQVTDMVGYSRDHFLICSISWGRKSGAEVWDSSFTLPLHS